MIECSSLPLGSLAVWLKLDSGMHRCGFDAKRVPSRSCSA